jgi:predicted dehydrogenase
MQDIGESGVAVGRAGPRRFAGGATAQIYSGLRAPFVQGAPIIGSAGLIGSDVGWIPGMNRRREPGPAAVSEFSDRAGRVERSPVPASNPWQQEVAAMAACVLDGAAPVVALRQSRAFLKSSLALRESARPGKLVALQDGR